MAARTGASAAQCAQRSASVRKPCLSAAGEVAERHHTRSRRGTCRVGQGKPLCRQHSTPPYGDTGRSGPSSCEGAPAVPVGAGRREHQARYAHMLLPGSDAWQRCLHTAGDVFCPQEPRTPVAATGGHHRAPRPGAPTIGTDQISVLEPESRLTHRPPQVAGSHEIALEPRRGSRRPPGVYPRETRSYTTPSAACSSRSTASVRFGLSISTPNSTLLFSALQEKLALVTSRRW